MKGRVAFGVIIGAIGLGCGVASIVMSLPGLGLAAGVLAALGLVPLFLIQKVLEEAKQMVAGATAISALRELQLESADGEGSSLQRMVDSESGLPDQSFFELALDSRLNAARRRLWPITVVEIEIFTESNISEEKLHQMIVAFAGVARLTLRGSDIACRVGATSFALILEDTDERGGELAMDRLISACANQDFGIRRLAAGVACYPNHGLTSQDVLSQAWIALGRACAHNDGSGESTVEVAKNVDQIADQTTSSD